MDFKGWTNLGKGWKMEEEGRKFFWRLIKGNEDWYA